jgi:hypothetical protein
VPAMIVVVLFSAVNSAQTCHRNNSAVEIKHLVLELSGKSQGLKAFEFGIRSSDFGGHLKRGKDDIAVLQNVHDCRGGENYFVLSINRGRT